MESGKLERHEIPLAGKDMQLGDLCELGRDISEVRTDALLTFSVCRDGLIYALSISIGKYQSLETLLGMSKADDIQLL